MKTEVKGNKFLKNLTGKVAKKAVSKILDKLDKESVDPSFDNKHQILTKNENTTCIGDNNITTYDKTIEDTSLGEFKADSNTKDIKSTGFSFAGAIAIFLAIFICPIIGAVIGSLVANIYSVMHGAASFDPLVLTFGAIVGGILGGILALFFFIVVIHQ